MCVGCVRWGAVCVCVCGGGGAQRDARQEGGSATSAVPEGHTKAWRGGLVPHPARGRMLKRCSRGTSAVGALSQVASRGQVCQRLPAWRLSSIRSTGTNASTCALAGVGTGRAAGLNPTALKWCCSGGREGRLEGSKAERQREHRRHATPSAVVASSAEKGHCAGAPGGGFYSITAGG